MSVTIADIEAARTIAGTVLRTPMLPAPKLSALTGADIFVKYENLQVTNSFKDRGALNKLASLPPARERGVIAMSAGNHAQAVAYHAARLAIPATIVMPVTTPFVKVEATRAHGAEVVLEGESVAEAQVRAGIARERALTFVHPYDDPLVIAGQGTIALEMLEARPRHAGDPDRRRRADRRQRHRRARAQAAIEIVGAEAALYPSFWNALTGEEPPARRLDLGGRHRGEECRRAGAADRARARLRDHPGRRGAARTRGQRLPDPAEDHGRGRRRRRPCGDAGQAGQVPRPQGRADPLWRQHRSAHPRLGHGARARARAPHRLLPADHPDRPGVLGQIATRLGRSAPTSSRSSTAGSSSTCRPRAPSST